MKERTEKEIKTQDLRELGDTKIPKKAQEEEEEEEEKKKKGRERKIHPTTFNNHHVTHTFNPSCHSESRASSPKIHP
jgi:hypothetical protein